VIIAGSIGTATSNTTISTFSDQAGADANSYLVALGFHDRAPDNTGAQFLWDGTSFAAPTISGAVALMAQAFPNLTGQQIVQILFSTADDLGDPGVDAVYGHGELDLARAFAPQGQTTMADSKTPVTGSNGDGSPVMGDAFAKHSLGAIILDGYSRAYVLNLAKTIRQAAVDHPLSRSLQSDARVASANAGPFSVAMTVSVRHDLRTGYSVGAMNIGPEDLRKSRLVAGSAVAKIDKNTAIAFGFADGAKEMERRLTGVPAGAFLVANDVTGNPGFMASRHGSMALRHQFGRFGVTLSGETGDVWQDVKTTATGSPYRWSSVAVDRTLGRNWLQVGMSRLQETQTLLGGRLGGVLGGGGSSTLFLDAQARHDFGNGWSGSLTARHGWTDFASGKFQTGAYSIDLSKQGLFGTNDSLAFRIAQPLRVEHGGIAMMLPTSYDYVTGTAMDTMETMSLRPSGREVDGEVSYGRTLLGGNAWLGTNLFYRRDPGHIANSPDDVGGALRFSLNF
jgi:hypothetical protein